MIPFILSLGHLVTDVNQGALPLILPHLRDAFSLSYTEAGLLVLVFNASSSIVQPLFGYLSDRSHAPWLMPLGCLVAALGMAAAGICEKFFFLVLAVLLSGLGVAAYHPEASKTMYYAGQGGRAASMSVFSVGGNLGFGLGPLVAGYLVAMAGLRGTAGLLVPGLVLAAVLWAYVPRMRMLVEGPGKKEVRVSGGGRVPVTGIILLLGVVIVRSWIHAGMTSFLPFYCVDHLGVTPVVASHLDAVYLLSGALGTLLGGPLADRFGRKSVIVGSMLLIGPLTLWLLNARGWWIYVSGALAGMVVVCTFAVTIVFAQEMMPYNVGIASGLVLGFAVGTGGLGVTVLGAIADHFSLLAAMRAILLLPVAGLILGLFLPGHLASAEARAGVVDKKVPNSDGDGAATVK